MQFTEKNIGDFVKILLEDQEARYRDVVWVLQHKTGSSKLQERINGAKERMISKRKYSIETNFIDEYRRMRGDISPDRIRVDTLNSDVAEY